MRLLSKHWRAAAAADKFTRILTQNLRKNLANKITPTSCTSQLRGFYRNIKNSHSSGITTTTVARETTVLLEVLTWTLQVLTWMLDS